MNEMDWKNRAETAEARVKELEKDNALAFARIDSLTNGYDTVNKVLTTAIGLQSALEKIEARTGVLEETLKEISKMSNIMKIQNVAKAALVSKEKS